MPTDATLIRATKWASGPSVTACRAFKMQHGDVPQGVHRSCSKIDRVKVARGGACSPGGKRAQRGNAWAFVI
eukprot:13778510-Alexandrium_andersonii.AAC.1